MKPFNGTARIVTCNHASWFWPSAKPPWASSFCGWLSTSLFSRLLLTCYCSFLCAIFPCPHFVTLIFYLVPQQLKEFALSVRDSHFGLSKGFLNNSIHLFQCWDLNKNEKQNTPNPSPLRDVYPFRSTSMPLIFPCLSRVWGIPLISKLMH